MPLALMKQGVTGLTILVNLVCIRGDFNLIFLKCGIKVSRKKDTDRARSHSEIVDVRYKPIKDGVIICLSPDVSSNLYDNFEHPKIKRDSVMKMLTINCDMKTALLPPRFIINFRDMTVCIQQ